MTEKHIPVLIKESIDYLNIKNDGTYVDCTLGRGGHSSQILKKIPFGKLYAIDQDQTAIKEGSITLQKIGTNFKILNGNFKDISSLLALENEFNVDGILYDLGVSSPQLDIADRGFSYRFDGPLDMRMDQINNKLTAEIIVNTYSKEMLAKIFFRYADEKFANQIATNIVKLRPINSTLQLVDVIKKSLPQKILKQPKHPAKKVFQALRIEVNNEVETFKTSLEESMKLLKSKGRMVVITFHSLEERIVKEIFKEATTSPEDQIIKSLPIAIESTAKFTLILKKPLKPSLEEMTNNKRAHSSKLWVMEKK